MFFFVRFGIYRVFLVELHIYSNTIYKTNTILVLFIYIETVIGRYHTVLITKDAISQLFLLLVNEV